MLGKPIEELKLISCHLGNGSSITAIDGGKSVDTSMGFTPLAGLPMGTRSGDLDAGILEYLMHKHGYNIDKMLNVLNKKSGVLGVSGVSSDFRDLEAAAPQGNQRAQLALDVFDYSVKKFIGSYAAAMGGVDAIIFTAGVGENGPDTRANVGLRPGVHGREDRPREEQHPGQGSGRGHRRLQGADSGHPHQRGTDDRHGYCRHCPRLISGIEILPARCAGRIFLLVGMTSELPRRGNSRRANSLRPSIKKDRGPPAGLGPAGEHPHQRGTDDRHGYRRHCPRLISGIEILPARCAGRIFLLVGMTSELPRRGNSRRANSLRPSIKKDRGPRRALARWGASPPTRN